MVQSHIYWETCIPCRGKAAHMTAYLASLMTFITASSKKNYIIVKKNRLHHVPSFGLKILLSQKERVSTSSQKCSFFNSQNVARIFLLRTREKISTRTDCWQTMNTEVFFSETQMATTRSHRVGCGALLQSGAGAWPWLYLLHPDYATTVDRRRLLISEQPSLES